MIKKQWLRSGLLAVFSASAGFFGYTELIAPEYHSPEVFFTLNSEEGDYVFETVGGTRYMEHPLMMPFSKGRMLDTADFQNEPFAAYEVTTRSRALTALTGIYFVTDIQNIADSESFSGQRRDTPSPKP